MQRGEDAACSAAGVTGLQRPVACLPLPVSVHLIPCHSSCDLRAGFVIWDYYDRWHEFLDEVSPLVSRGEIHFEETEMRGFDKLPEALAGLFKGVNIGKVRWQELSILHHNPQNCLASDVYSRSRSCALMCVPLV